MKALKAVALLLLMAIGLSSCIVAVPARRGPGYYHHPHHHGGGGHYRR